MGSVLFSSTCFPTSSCLVMRFPLPGTSCRHKYIHPWDVSPTDCSPLLPGWHLTSPKELEGLRGPTGAQPHTSFHPHGAWNSAGYLIRAYGFIYISLLPLWVVGFAAADDKKMIKDDKKNTSYCYSIKPRPNKTLLLPEEGVFLTMIINS